MKSSVSVFGYLNNKKVEAYRFENGNGASVTILTMGGIIQQLWMPDKNGKLQDIVCGFDTVEGYLTGGGYFGSLVGRYANRIGGASFTLDGKTYPLFVNSGKKDHLHGGEHGFNQKIWSAEQKVTAEQAVLTLRYTSPDGEEGYPGRLRVTVTYTFDEENKLSIRYQATTDAPTVVNLTNHSYFNLDGYDGGSVMEETLFIDADEYTVVDDDLIPLPGAAGRAPVDGTPFDFRQPRKIAQPFDHSFHLSHANGMVRRSAEVRDEHTGRVLTLYTSMSALQLYTGCVMNEPVAFKGGVPQRPLHALCLETQFAPDSPNRKDGPSCVLRPGDSYDFTTVFAFGVEK